MKPYLKNNKTNKVEKAVTRRITLKDIDELMRVQAAAVAALDDPSVYVVSSRDDFKGILNRGGEIHGIFTKDGLCGACSVYVPGNPGESLGVEAGIPKNELPLCANIDSVFVAPDYAHNGIARELIKTCINRAVENLGANYVLATVSPKNVPSILSFMSLNGVRLKALAQKYGYKLRYIMCYNHSDKRLFTVYERYALGDVYSISRALSNGYEGIATFKTEDDVFIWLAK